MVWLVPDAALILPPTPLNIKKVKGFPNQSVFFRSNAVPKSKAKPEYYPYNTHNPHGNKTLQHC